MIADELRLRGVKVAELRRSGMLAVFDARKTLSSFMVSSVPDPLLFNSAAAEILEPLCRFRF